LRANWGDEKMKKILALFLLVMSAIICFSINPVSAAQTLNIDSIVPYTRGTDTILNITITHQSPLALPGEWVDLDYVDHIEIEIDGAFPYITVNTADYQLTHFTVQYNMGEISGTPTVRVRACHPGAQGE
jgi:hypothetical protein